MPETHVLHFEEFDFVIEDTYVTEGDDQNPVTRFTFRRPGGGDEIIIELDRAELVDINKFRLAHS